MQCTFSYPFQQNTLGCYQDATASEFVVDTNSLVNYVPKVAALGNGSFVVVWWDGSGGNIHGRRYDDDGTIGAEFIVDTNSLLNYDPHVAALGNGSFVVVWEDRSADHDIHGRRYDGNGTVGAEFVVNTNALDNYDPHVAALGNGSFVVVWYDGSGGYQNIHGRRYDDDGTIGAEFLVDTNSLVNFPWAGYKPSPLGGIALAVRSD